MLLQLLRHSHCLLTRLSQVAPCPCALCGSDSGGLLCADCDARFFSARHRRCRRCAIPLPPATRQADQCGKCLANTPAFDATVAAVDYAPPVDQLVLGLKFGGRLELAHLAAAKLATAVRAAGIGPALVTAIPLGPARLAERGFNQAAEIGRPLTRLLGIPLDLGLLQRRRDTGAQAMLHPDARRKNVRRAFIVPAQAIATLQGAHVGVLDDVMTTGETLNEAALTLKRAGAARVTNLVFARTVD